MRFITLNDATTGWTKAKEITTTGWNKVKGMVGSGWNNAKEMLPSDVDSAKRIIYHAVKNTLNNNKGLILSASASTVLLAALGLNARGRAFTDLFALSMYTINAAGIAFPAFVMGKCVKEAYAEIKRMIAEGVETYEEVNARYYQGKKNFGSLNRERLAKVIEYTDGNYWEWSDVSAAVNNIAKSSLNFAHKVVKPSLNFANDKVVKPSLNWVVKPSLNFANDKVVKPSLNFANDKVVKPSLNFANDKVVKPSLNFANDKVVKPSVNLLGKLVPQKIKDTLSKYLNSAKEVELYNAEEDMYKLDKATRNEINYKDYFNEKPLIAEIAERFNPLAYAAKPLHENIKPEYKTAEGHLHIPPFEGDDRYDDLVNTMDDSSIAARVIRHRRGN